MFQNEKLSCVYEKILTEKISLAESDKLFEKEILELDTLKKIKGIKIILNNCLSENLSRIRNVFFC